VKEHSYNCYKCKLIIIVIFLARGDGETEGSSGIKVIKLFVVNDNMIARVVVPPQVFQGKSNICGQG